MTVFDYINSITFDKKDLFKDSIEKDEYNPYLVNKFLSYFPDTIFYSNEMNKLHNIIPKEYQYKFYLHAIPKRKRFIQWDKKEISFYDNISLIKDYYKYNTRKAIEVLSVLTEEQLNIIKMKLNKGGTKNGNTKQCRDFI